MSAQGIPVKLKTYHVRDGKLHDQAPNSVRHCHQSLCHSAKAKSCHFRSQDKPSGADRELIDYRPDIDEHHNSPTSLGLVWNAAHDADEKEHETEHKLRWHDECSPTNYLAQREYCGARQEHGDEEYDRGIEEVMDVNEIEKVRCVPYYEGSSDHLLDNAPDCLATGAEVALDLCTDADIFFETFNLNLVEGLIILTIHSSQGLFGMLVFALSDEPVWRLWEEGKEDNEEN
jgi:hypothetical protein